MPERTIQLTKGYQAIVDEADYKWLNQFSWIAYDYGRRRTAYAMGRVNGKIALMHRLIMNPAKGMEVDHINGNGLDNRRSNLRICTRKENSQNSRGQLNHTSRFRGVCRRSDSGAILAQCNRKYLGQFNSEEEAARAYDAAAIQEFGEFARLNFPHQN